MARGDGCAASLATGVGHDGVGLEAERARDDGCAASLATWVERWGTAAALCWKLRRNVWRLWLPWKEKYGTI